MPNPVVLIHGWSATSAAMSQVAAFLQANGFQVAEIWLGDYVSLDDDVRVADVAKRMDAVLRAAVLTAGTVRAPFDMVVHSTGGLVAREWLVSHAPTWPGGAPLKRLVMLAPANFGSRLASLGKSMIGRIAKGWNNWFEVGAEMLRNLELASPYQWDLARRDLVAEAPGQPSPYGPGRALPFVICGSRGYASGLQKIANEHGSDGVVRPAAANLNVQGLTVDFATGERWPKVTPWLRRTGAEQLAFAVLPDRDHGTIVKPLAGGGRLPALILEALRSDDAGYPALCAAWDRVSEETAALADPRAASDELHQFLQLVTRVIDDQGLTVPDYFMEFFSPQVAGAADTVDFQRLVLKDVHVNGQDKSLRCLFADRTALFSQFYKGARTQVAMSLSAAPLGDNIRYFESTKAGATGELIVHERDAAARAGLGAERLWRNRTHLVEIRVPRQPRDKVFRMKPAG